MRVKGFSMIELMVALAVGAILLALAGPAFTRILARQKISTVAGDLSSDIVNARAEAIRRGAVVQICSSNDGATCSGTWNNGWIVWADADGSGGPSAAEIVRARSLAPSRISVVEGTPVLNAAFRGNGALALGLPPLALTVCYPGERGRVIAVQAAGATAAYATAAVCP